MNNQKNTKNETLLDNDLCEVMGKQRQEGAAVKQPAKRTIGILAAEEMAGIERQSGRKIGMLAAEKEKMLTVRRHRQIKHTARWISFLFALAYFLFWATGKELIQPVISMPGICICTAVSGYQLGYCLSNLQMMPVIKEEVI